MAIKIYAADAAILFLCYSYCEVISDSITTRDRERERGRKKRTKIKMNTATKKRKRIRMRKAAALMNKM